MLWGVCGLEVRGTAEEGGLWIPDGGLDAWVLCTVRVGGGGPGCLGLWETSQAGGVKCHRAMGGSLGHGPRPRLPRGLLGTANRPQFAGWGRSLDTWVPWEESGNCGRQARGCLEPGFPLQTEGLSPRWG